MAPPYYKKPIGPGRTARAEAVGRQEIAALVRELRGREALTLDLAETTAFPEAEEYPAKFYIRRLRP